MQIAILIFDGLTALDAIGPYEVLTRLPGAELRFVAEEAGTKRTDTGTLGVQADLALADVDAPDVVLVPGGKGSRPLMRDPQMLEWLRSVHESSTWTTSVCTGALVLGAAGILDGKRATTHWAYLDRLSEFGAQPVTERVVADGKVITAAGVSAGIDMALTLAARIAGEPVAQAIQLGMEYDPAPPFDAGSPSKAPPEAIELIRAAERAQSEQSPPADP
jgi:transcriptional regulator GlxA family with amidase domain